MKRETDQNFRKTPSRRGKPIKTSEKRLPAAGNGKNSQKNGFPRRERGKNARKTPSCGGKAVKFAGDRFPAAGKGANSPKNAFRRAKSIFKKPPSPPREDIESPPGACLIRYPMRERAQPSLPGRARPPAWPDSRGSSPRSSASSLGGGSSCPFPRRASGASL